MSTSSLWRADCACGVTVPGGQFPRLADVRPSVTMCLFNRVGLSANLLFCALIFSSHIFALCRDDRATLARTGCFQPQFFLLF